MQKLFIKDREFYKTAAGIAVPIALQGLITTGVNMMDTIMIGAVGETQLSAVSLANQFINIFHIFCMGIGMGASVLVARYYGMKDGKSLKSTVAIMLRLCLAMAALFFVATMFLPRQIMQIYTVEEPIIANGVRYLEYSVATYFLLGLSLTCTIVLRNVGQVRIPLYTSIAAFFINVGANYIFIFGKLGAPRMEVAGAAVGTLIARIFEFSVICGYLFFRDREIGFRVKDIFPPVGNLWREYIRISIPVLISDGILALGNNSVAMVIGRLGENFVAANAVTAVTQQLSSVMIQGFSQAGAIVTGHTLGEGDREKAHRQGYGFLGLGLVFGLVAAVIILLISGPMISAYNLSEQTRKIARELMLSISIIVVFQATNSIMTKGVLRGGGDTKILMVADNIFLWVASIPLGILAGPVLHLPAFWIYFFLKIDQILKAVWCVFRLQSGKWIKKIKASAELGDRPVFLDTSFLKNEELQLILEKTADGDKEKGWLPAYYFAICDHSGARVGSCDLRIGHNLNVYYGGNIGYGVEESYRGRHYAAKACLLLFELARKHGMEYLIITCNPDNYPSRKTCEYAGGILQEIVELPEDNDMRPKGDKEKCIYKFVL